MSSKVIHQHLLNDMTSVSDDNGPRDGLGFATAGDVWSHVLRHRAVAVRGRFTLVVLGALDELRLRGPRLSSASGVAMGWESHLKSEGHGSHWDSGMGRPA